MIEWAIWTAIGTLAALVVLGLFVICATPRYRKPHEP